MIFAMSKTKTSTVNFKYTKARSNQKRAYGFQKVVHSILAIFTFKTKIIAWHTLNIDLGGFGQGYNKSQQQAYYC